ncbi:MAG: radical SAM protein [Lachnospira sp.]|nr:radical SAM protein [Lachnospira sp.]
MSKIRFKRIYIEITSSCNLSCSFCQETKRPKEFLSVENFAHILQEVRPYTNFVYLHVKGEPLLHPQLEEILKLCRQSGVTVNVTTNGTLLKKQLPTLLKYPPHQINISLHSADDNDCIDIDTYIKDVFYSCEEITDKTETEISLRLWNTKNDPTIFGEKNYKVKERIHINVQSPFEWPDINNTYYNDRGFCQGLRLHMAILSNGTVVPCCLDGNGVMALGNIFEESFKNILEGPRATAIIQGFRDKKAVEPLCQHCSFKERFSDRL